MGLGWVQQALFDYEALGLTGGFGAGRRVEPSIRRSAGATAQGAARPAGCSILRAFSPYTFLSTASGNPKPCSGQW